MEMITKGAFLASAAAGLIGQSFGCASSDKTPSMHDAPMSGVMCSGVNGCGGQGSCASADNACKGQNTCKGKGWVMVGDADACAKQGGVVVTKTM